jgi:hypothetical protein
VASDVSKTGVLADAYGRVLHIGHDHDAVYIAVGDVRIFFAAGDFDDAMKLLMDADTEAKAWAEANGGGTDG